LLLSGGINKVLDPRMINAWEKALTASKAYVPMGVTVMR
jgi:hypothetical protein